MTSTDETDVWVRALAGDERAFAVLFDLHRHRVFRHAYRLLTNIPDAEDATAVAFLELWRRRKAVKVINGSTLPWLLLTTTNTARNLRRGKNRYQSLIDALPHTDHQPSVDEVAFIDAISDQTLAGALSRLSAKDLHLVTLVLLEGYSAAEAGVITNMTAGTVRTRLHRARSALRNHLGQPTFARYLESQSGDLS